MLSDCCVGSSCCQSHLCQSPCQPITGYIGPSRLFNHSISSMLRNGDRSDGRKRLSISRRQHSSLDDCRDDLVHLRTGMDLLDIGGNNTTSSNKPGSSRAADRVKTSRTTNSAPCCADVIDDAQQIFRQRNEDAETSKGLEQIPFMAPSSSKQIKTNYSDDMQCNFLSPASCLSTVAVTPLSAVSNSPTLGVQVLYDDDRVALPIISPTNKAIDGTRNNRVDNSTFRQSCIAAIKSPAHHSIVDRTFPILSTRNRSLCNIDEGDADKVVPSISSSSEMKDKRGQRVRFSPSLSKCKLEMPATTTQSSKKPIPDSSAVRKLLRKYREEARASSSPSQLLSLPNSSRIKMMPTPFGGKAEGDVSMSKRPSANAGSSSPSPPCSQYSTIARSVYAVSRLEQAKHPQLNLAKTDDTKDQSTVDNFDCYSSPLDLTSQQSC